MVTIFGCSHLRLSFLVPAARFLLPMPATGGLFMDHKQLRFFRKICEEKSINRAAQKLFISQQALSKSIAKLEKEVGVPLLVRTPEGVRLTVAGQLLEQRAGLYLEEHDDILRQLRATQEGPHLRIGCFMGLLQELPPRFFGRFMDAHPEVKFHFHSYTDTERSRAYQNDNCDLVISTAPLGQGFVELACLKNPIGIIFSRSHILHGIPAPCLSDLKDLPLITLNTENRAQTQLLELLQAHGLVVDTVLGDADGDLLEELLQRGFVSFYAGKRSALPAWTEFRFLTDLDLVWEFYIYGRRGRRLLPVEKELIRSILAAVRPEEEQR